MINGLRNTLGPWANRNGFVAWNQEITRSGWGAVNYSLHPDNARSLLDQLSRVLNPAEHDSRDEGESPS